MSSFGSRRSIRNGDVLNQSLGVVLVNSALENTNSSLYLRSTEEMTWKVELGDAVVVRRWVGDGKLSEKKERWPEVKFEMAWVTSGWPVEGQLDEQIWDHSF